MFSELMFDMGQRLSLFFFFAKIPDYVISWLMVCMRRRKGRGGGGGEQREEKWGQASLCVHSVSIHCQQACKAQASTSIRTCRAYKNIHPHEPIGTHGQMGSSSSSFTRSEIRDLVADSDSVNDLTLANTSATESTALCVLCLLE